MFLHLGSKREKIKKSVLQDNRELACDVTRPYMRYEINLLSNTAPSLQWIQCCLWLKKRTSYTKLEKHIANTNVKQPTLAYLKCDHTGSLYNVLHFQATPHEFYVPFAGTPHDVWNVHDCHWRVACDVLNLAPTWHAFLGLWYTIWKLLLFFLFFVVVVVVFGRNIVVLRVLYVCAT